MFGCGKQPRLVVVVVVVVVVLMSNSLLERWQGPDGRQPQLFFVVVDPGLLQVCVCTGSNQAAALSIQVPAGLCEERLSLGIYLFGFFLTR